MILYIDTCSEMAEVAVWNDKKIAQTYSKLPDAENFALEIKNFLKKNKIKPANLSNIAVRVGPGYFSRLRTGVVAANALAYGLKLKVVAVGPETKLSEIAKMPGQAQVLPVYGQNPHITMSKPNRRKGGI
jgi:tRNA A37 threonylcarbamoyladenosine modification protein TsaB